MSEENIVSTGRKRSSFAFIGYLLIIILFAATWLGGFWIWQQHQLLKLQLTHSQQNLDNLNHGLLDQSKSMAQQSTAIQSQQTLITQLQTALTQTQTDISRNQNSWRLIEAEHLLTVANIALQVQHNIPATTLLLQNADQLLQIMNEPLLSPVRQMIANDLLKLKTVPNIDVNGLYTQLTVLAQQTKSLPIVINQYSPNTQDNLLSPTPTKTKSIWQNSLFEIKKALSQLVIIRRTDAPVSPLPSAFQQTQVLQQLSLLFSQAQSALLLRDNAIYQNSLNQIITLTHYYTAMNPASQAITTEIQKLQTDINPALPDISDALHELQSVANKINSNINPAVAAKGASS